MKQMRLPWRRILAQYSNHRWTNSGVLDKTQIGFDLNPENSEKFSCVKYRYSNFPRICFYLDGVQECAISRCRFAA
ncbi:MAG: hypothetical protein DWI22_07210 [Planctomycetota bacterium]|nr:MAG: hypothetical protein DWI22_07210 [Planctomycetota bacterium]